MTFARDGACHELRKAACTQELGLFDAKLSEAGLVEFALAAIDRSLQRSLGLINVFHAQAGERGARQGELIGGGVRASACVRVRAGRCDGGVGGAHVQNLVANRGHAEHDPNAEHDGGGGNPACG